MRLFDLHCDTIGECFKQKKPLLDSDLHISLCKVKYLDNWAQAFAIWIPDELRGAKAEEYFKNVFLNFKNELSLNSDKIELCQRNSDIKRINSEGKCAALLACEGASPFAFDGGAQAAFEYGVKLITLTWNDENEIAFGCQDDIKKGLKPLGKRLISDMARLGIAADVSHLNRPGFFDVIESGVPVLASHSNSLEVLRETSDDEVAFNRSLTDEQIRLLVQAGGLIGLNFCCRFLGGNGFNGIEAICRHAEHMLELGAEDCLAIGSDYDGCGIADEICGIDKMPALYNYFAGRGFGAELLDKIFYTNALNFFENLA